MSSVFPVRGGKTTTTKKKGIRIKKLYLGSVIKVGGEKSIILGIFQFRKLKKIYYQRM